MNRFYTIKEVKTVSDNPKISVIIPAFNAERYITECIKSIQNNSYRNLEIIIVNDGSKDNTLHILEDLKKRDGRIVIVNQENGGVSRARNKGLDIAKGEYIAFVDSDDRIREDYFDKLIKPCIEQGTDSACCVYKMVDKNGNRIPDNRIIFKDEFFITPQQIADNYFDCLNMGIVNCVPRIHKKSIVGNTRFSETLKLGEDASFNLEIFKKANKIYVSPEEMYFYVVHSEQTTAKKMNGYADMMIQHIGDIDSYISLYDGYRLKSVRQGMGKVCLEVSVGCVYHSEFMRDYKENIIKFQQQPWFSYIKDPGEISLRWSLINKLLVKKQYSIVYLISKSYTVITYFKRKIRNLLRRI